MPPRVRGRSRSPTSPAASRRQRKSRQVLPWLPGNRSVAPSSNSSPRRGYRVNQSANCRLELNVKEDSLILTTKVNSKLPLRRVGNIANSQECISAPFGNEGEHVVRFICRFTCKVNTRTQPI